ncbi:MAG: LemA family protein [Prevotellaceae bacterium]|jgi:LemA protein|nr:LemA family protein [Prevotellaceae bacterium]
MKKLGTKFVVIIVLAIIALLVFGAYNGLVKSDEEVKSQWGNVQTQYQRRANLIPNLVETVKGYATHEQETLEGVIEARAKATQITIDPTQLTAEKLQEYQKAQGEITSALGKILALREAYPDLKANQNFLELQQQLESTENRISTEITRFNEMAKEYNVKIRKVQNVIIARICGFEQKPYFEAQQDADIAPKVQF